MKEGGMEDLAPFIEGSVGGGGRSGAEWLVKEGVRMKTI